MNGTGTFRGYVVRYRLTDRHGHIDGLFYFLDLNAPVHTFLSLDPNDPEDEITLEDGQCLHCRIVAYNRMDRTAQVVGYVT